MRTNRRLVWRSSLPDPPPQSEIDDCNNTLAAQVGVGSGVKCGLCVWKAERDIHEEHTAWQHRITPGFNLVPKKG